MLRIVFLLLLACGCQAAGVNIKVETSGQIVQGSILEVSVYDQSEFEIYTSEGPDDDSMIKITCTPNISAGVVKIVNVTFVADTELNGYNVKIMEVSYESILAQSSALPRFTSSFQPSSDNNVVREWLVN